ncbi:hypothetical protein VFPPC_18207 [Pochonia chlamydosporia 170]|uniref:Uncharacterized protein n=1 Tax=Pochonia chlamydosporia 170 TaxID=1380566 RepID=A0A219AP88_METCM|nr:hypothetical protein VFPPC_18207 [Pochonia chlamydosporia 170]OWT42647.1 hypothetical protein VFPPC_18207 [Pochonia chlamydosporia 170]
MLLPIGAMGMVLRSISLLAITRVAAAYMSGKLAVSPSYNGRDACPYRCVDSGPMSGNWSVYHNLDQLLSCKENMFYDFSLHDPVDDPNTLHRIYACTTYGPDWLDLPAQAPKLASTDSVNATFTVGWWPQQGAMAASLPKLLISHVSTAKLHLDRLCK